MVTLSVRQILRIIKIFGTVTFTWPPDQRAGKIKRFLYEVGWLFSVLNVMALLIPLILGAYHYRHNVTTMMKSLSELTALTEVFCNLILCRYQRQHLQNLITTINTFEAKASAREKVILEKYMFRYAPFSALVGVSYIMAAIAFSCGPLLLPIPLPAEAWYPFSIESAPTKSLLYIQHVTAILQTGFCIVVDFMVAMFFWYSISSLEILSLELHDLSNLHKLKPCVIKHQKIIRFVEETQYGVRYVLFKTNLTMTSAVICGAFELIYHEPLAVVSQFICMVIGGCLRLYITAWPADDLREKSEDIVWAGYNTPWPDSLPHEAKTLSILMQRSQKALVISMGGLLPSLSLQYYASFLYTTISYFMTMRAVINK